MKIALLNFPLDSNYGGNLQRFALIKVLQELGHDPVHLFTKLYFKKESFVEFSKRLLYSIIHLQKPAFISPEKETQKKYENEIKKVLQFYNKYVPHTASIDHPRKLSHYQNFDAFIVGSDQVWRRSMSAKFPFSTMFLDWVHNSKSVKIAYGVSFGIHHHEIPDNEINNLSKLYKTFKAVSVRESSALKILSKLNWTTPQATQVLDPSFLINKEVYLDLVAKGNTTPPNGNLFCYILDADNNTEGIIDSVAKEKKLSPFNIGLDCSSSVSIEQWLRSFVDAQYVITDSYHGCVFSIIFNKPFKLIRNERRGFARYESLFSILGINDEQQYFEWETINATLFNLKQQSIEFLKQSLNDVP